MRLQGPGHKKSLSLPSLPLTGNSCSCRRLVGSGAGVSQEAWDHGGCACLSLCSGLLKARVTLLPEPQAVPRVHPVLGPASTHQSRRGLVCGSWRGPARRGGPYPPICARGSQGGVSAGWGGGEGTEAPAAALAHPTLLLLLLQVPLQDLLLIGDDAPDAVDEVALVVGDEADEDRSSLS